MHDKKLDTLSANILTIMREISANKNIQKMILRNHLKPFEETIVTENIKNIMNPLSSECKIFPFPFNPSAQTEENTTIRVFYPSGVFDSKLTWAENSVAIDIIVSRNLWLIVNEDSNPVIRPYVIMSEIVDQLDQKRFDHIGALRISDFEHLSVNQDFDAIRIKATFDTLEYQRS